MTKNNNFYWSFQKLPFIYKEQDAPNNTNSIPNNLPFELTIDKETGLLKQIPNDLVNHNLEKAYEQGSVVGGVITDDSDNKLYADDFINFLLSALNKNQLNEQKILEIGSGTGYLLSEIKKFCPNVIGIEPGNHCLVAKEKYNVKIIHDFFPTKKIDGKFDVIIMSIVFEHFENPLNFLEVLSEYLNDTGVIILSVPDSEPFILSGDISILFHEHYSYFTNTSLDNVVKKGGYKVFNQRKSVYGGLLFKSILKEENQSNFFKSEYLKAFNESSSYIAKAQKQIYILTNFLSDIQKESKSLGVYVPARFLNILFLSGIKIDKLRFFDDNPLIKNKFYPGFNIKIENKIDLFNNPTDIVFIFSNSFGENIKENIKDELPLTTKILLWKDVFK
jgi:2-polyprenyl-3-methyl-5-hydroxy-6-metoxy-1,4-benzoquinol methylase